MVLVLFDIDGTLITSGGTGRKAISRALSDFVGREVDMSTISLGGRTDPAIVRDILLQCGFEGKELQKLIPPCLELYSDELGRTIQPHHVSLLPGVQVLLDELYDNPDFSLGLVTGNLQKTAYMKLGAGNIASYFPCGGFGSDHESRNQLPFFARDRAAAHYGKPFESEKTIIIGDTNHDIACSRHFGAWAVAVSTGMSTHEQLATDHPDLLLASLDDSASVWSFLGSVLDG